MSVAVSFHSVTAEGTKGRERKRYTSQTACLELVQVQTQVNMLNKTEISLPYQDQNTCQARTQNTITLSFLMTKINA